MSRAVASIVLGRRFGSVSRKAVALVLSDHADGDEWTTVLGQERTAAEAELSVRQVSRILAAFEREGLIRRERRHRKDGTRTSDRLVLVRSAIEALPDSMSSSPQDTVSGGDGRLPDIERVDYRTSDAPTTGQALAEQEPSEEPSVEPPAAAAAELPAIRWARRWAELRGVVFTPVVRRSWGQQVQQFINAGGAPSEALLQRALAEGLREPKAWAYLSAPDDEPVPDWVERMWADQRAEAGEP